ncbi:sugar-binding protein, partial [Planctomycetota bacterium]
MELSRASILVILAVAVQGVLAESPIPVKSPGVPEGSSVCYRAPVTPVIDGDLSEWMEDPETGWIGAAFKYLGTPDDILDGRHNYWDGPHDMSSTWSMMWDDDYLYFAAAITDDYLNKLEPPNIASLAQDVTLFYLDVDGDLLVDMHLIMGIGVDANEPNQLYLMSSNNTCIDTERVLYPGHVAMHVMDNRLGPAGRFVELAIPMEPLQGCGLAVAEAGRFFGINPAQEESYNNSQTDGGGFVCWGGETAPKPVYFAEPIFKDVIAYGPSPIDTAVDQTRETTLAWWAGEFAASHDIYFGEDLDTVSNATKTSSEYQRTDPVDGMFGGFDPGLLTIGKTYYWRIDEVNDLDPNSPWKGNVWSFTVADFLVVDDFESYNNDPDQVYKTWEDGWDDDNNGAIVGYPEPDVEAGETYIEKDITHTGRQSLPFFYNTDGTLISELSLPLTGEERNLTRDGLTDLSLWFIGFPEPIGSMVEAPTGVFTVRGAGSDIYGDSDHFHYVYKEITGKATIIAKVESLQNDPGDPNTHEMAKAGVMIRDSLNDDAVYASVLMSKENGVRNQYRTNVGANTLRDFDPNVAVPYWVRLERTAGGLTRFYYSPDGETWDSTPFKAVTMYNPLYVGMVVSSRLDGIATEAVFSNVTITGKGSGGPWLNEDVGILSNQAESLYVAVGGALISSIAQHLCSQQLTGVR